MIDLISEQSKSAMTIAMASMPIASGSSTTSLASLGATAAIVASPDLADAVWQEFGRFRIRKPLTTISSTPSIKMTKILTRLRGGKVQKPQNGRNLTDKNSNTSSVSRGKSVAFMALAMACHYLGK